jgi:hypothetical protein
MKKVKVVLMAITMLTVVGGALAFKAQKAQGLLYCTSQFEEINPTNCPDQIPGFSLTGIGDPSEYSCTDVEGGVCSPTDTYVNAN